MSQNDHLPGWYPVACALAVVCGVWLIVRGAWWGWIYAPVGVLGLILWTVAP